MPQDFEHIQSRLNNIRSVGPILAALRTISLGSWQMALNRLRGLRDYSARLLSFLPLLLPHIDETRHGLPFLRGKTASRGQALPATERVIALVIGSERGLCGQYNAAIAARRCILRRTSARRGRTGNHGVRVADDPHTSAAKARAVLGAKPAGDALAGF